MPRFDDLDHVAVTDVGIRRSHNQDAFSIQKAPDRDYFKKIGHVFIVADGMGGHAVGEKASAKAVQEIPLTYAKHAQEGPLAALRRSFQEANAGIHGVGQSNPEFRGLGTTATTLVIREEGAWIGHVGDSRAYRVRGGKLEQLTFDHSYAWEMARRLGVPPEDLADVKKNVIIRSLGPDILVQVDVEGPYPLLSGDIFVLCSDGLSNLVTPEEVGTIVSAMPPTEAGKFMVELANLRGGPDNITAIIVRIGGDDPSTVAVTTKEATRLKMVLSRAWFAWNQLIPWPLTVLVAGFLLAVAAVTMSAMDVMKGQTTLLIVLASCCIIAGLAGLLVQWKRQDGVDSKAPEAPRRQNVYREYSCKIEPALIEKLRKLTLHLKEQLEGHSFPIDWANFRRHSVAAESYLNDGDLLPAFREECRALYALAHVFNKNRPREEGGFKPKWENAET